MTPKLSERLAAHLTAGTPAALVTVYKVRGSAPREAGATMLVTAGEVVGTIGGGRLEWDAIAEARGLLDRGLAQSELAVRLGPEIGQCCGGHIDLHLDRATAQTLERLQAVEAQEQAARPAILIFGAGHVGKALATALSPLPFKVRLIDSRAEEFAGFHADDVTEVLTDHMIVEVEAAPVNAAYLMMTHSHALDALIAGEVLARGDFAYLGIIGSQTKRKRFMSSFRQQGMSPRDLARITCPIGGNAIRDKRPAVIAALAAVELLTVYSIDNASSQRVVVGAETALAGKGGCFRAPGRW